MSVSLTIGGLHLVRGSETLQRFDDMQITGPSIVAIVGKNGVGKSTFFEALVGFLPCEGSVKVESSDSGLHDFALVPQESQLRAPLTVREMILQASGGITPSSERFSKITKATRVDALLEKRFPHLSSGQKKRALMARALLTGAPIILLDEPTSFLDPVQKSNLLALMDDLRAQGKILLWVTHDLEAACAHADQALLLHDDREPRLSDITDLSEVDVIEALYA